ncbi:MAG: TldD/PmbA family protein [Candidatus Heimdallarchaeota archaeon]
MEDRNEILVETSNKAIQMALKEGMDSAFINAKLKDVFSTRFANSAIHQNFTDYETRIEISLRQGRKCALVTINSLKERKMSFAVKSGAELVKALPEDPDSPGPLKEPQDYIKLQLNDPAIASLEPSNVADKVISGIHEAHDLSSKVKSVSGNLNLKNGIDYHISSEGHEILTPTTRITSTINVMSDDGHGESRSNSSFGEREFSKLPFKKEATQVAERALLGLNSQNVETGAFNVVLDHQAAASQMLQFGLMISGRFVLDNQSFLKDRIGEQVFSKSMTFVNDPHNANFLSAKALDAEGVATRKSTLVKNGILRDFAYDRLTANQMGTKSNACGIVLGNYGLTPFPDALSLGPGTRTRQQLIEDIDKGLLVTNLHYTNFIDYSRGTQTGMTKDGLFIIENGEIIGSAKNLRFTDSMPRMFNVVELSSEVSQVISYFDFALVAPAMKVDSMNFSSKTSH